MKVVFLQDVDGIANGGDVKEVKNGFARNYLIPKNMAAPATRNNLLQVEKFQSQASVNRVKQIDNMKELAEAIDETVVTIEMRAGANEQLYGSVTGTIIADAVSEIIHRNIDRQLVQLDDPIRKLGTFTVPIRVHSDISAKIKVIVHAIGTDPEDLESNDDEEDNVEINGSVVVDSELGEQIGKRSDIYAAEDGAQVEENSASKEDTT